MFIVFSVRLYSGAELAFFFSFQVEKGLKGPEELAVGGEGNSGRIGRVISFRFGLFL